ncbi:hypothetical protein HHK36_031310 [Tetracentron sinense]|uniref:Retrotransposon gag domain-containing protein n=1 Tax=Tetracentron sinense TaxID=13715 RepID=A0A835CZG5_TETSI|nr:hypothetical protein HHK36_031310 [Tetracentron sinense]
MADVTQISKLDETVGQLKETTETHGKVLQEMMQRLLILDIKLDKLSKEKGESSTEKSFNYSEVERGLQTRTMCLEFPKFDGNDPSERSGATTSWAAFGKALPVRFGPSQYEDLIALLSKLREASSVEHYQTQFEELANRTKGLNEAFMWTYFPPTALAIFCQRSGVSLLYKAREFSKTLFCLGVQEELELREEVKEMDAITLVEIRMKV